MCFAFWFSTQADSDLHGRSTSVVIVLSMKPLVELLKAIESFFIQCQWLLGMRKHNFEGLQNWCTHLTELLCKMLRQEDFMHVDPLQDFRVALVWFEMHFQLLTSCF